MVVVKILRELRYESLNVRPGKAKENEGDEYFLKVLHYINIH